MINVLLGIKKNMTSTYDARGRRVGATAIKVDSNFVTQIKSSEKDGYNSVQLGMGTKKSVHKPQLGHTKKAGLDQAIRWFREVKIKEEEQSDTKPGTEIKLDQVFSKGDEVKVTATSKGKGFQGGVRRHGFAGGPKTHGQSDRHRAPGSIGQGTTPGRVYKGKRMAGHMGMETVTTRGLEVVGIDKQNSLLLIKGAVPGPVGGLVVISKLGKIKGYTPPPEEKPDEEESSESAVQSVSESENAENTDTQTNRDTETPVAEEENANS